MSGMNDEKDATVFDQASDKIVEDISFSDDQGELTIHLTSIRRNADNMSSQSDYTGVWRWPASTLLGQFLYRHRKTLVQGKKVVEFGCGHGLLSTVCLRSGAKFVVASDASEACRQLAHYNLVQATHNIPSEDDIRERKFATCILKWGPKLDLRNLAACLCTIGTEGNVSANDSENSLLSNEERFDLSIGTELLYLRRGSSEDGWNIFNQGKYLFELNKAILKHQPCSCNHEEWSNQPRTSKCLQSVLSDECIPGENGIFLTVYSPRYRGMAHDLHDAAKDSGIFSISLHRDNCLTQELRDTKMFTDSRFIAASTCAKTLYEFTNIVDGRLKPANPWDDSDSEADYEEEDNLMLPDYFDSE